MKIIRNCSNTEKEKGGIYIITNTFNKKVYIGSAKKFRLRWNNHSSKLLQNKHDNNYLQSAFNKYCANWSFSILETIEDFTNIYNVEKDYINKYLNNGFELFNLMEVKDGLFILKKYIRYQRNKKVSNSNKGKLPKNYFEMRKKLERPILEYENNIFVKEYPSCKQAGLELNIDYKLINNLLTKKVKSLRQYPNKKFFYKDGLSSRSIRKKPCKKICSENGMQFNSAEEAGKYYNCNPNSIRQQINGKLKNKHLLKYII
jgi:group I intron endonuclease